MCENNTDFGRISAEKRIYRCIIRMKEIYHEILERNEFSKNSDQVKEMENLVHCAINALIDQMGTDNYPQMLFYLLTMLLILADSRCLHAVPIADSFWELLATVEWFIANHEKFWNRAIKHTIEQAGKIWEADYRTFGQSVGRYMQLRHKIEVYNQNNAFSLAELQEDFPKGEKERAYALFQTLDKRSEKIQKKLVEIFKDFYADKLGNNAATAEKQIQQGIRNMLAVTANHPCYLYVLPYYIFLVFLQKYDMIMGVEKPSKKKEKKETYFVRLWFKKGDRKEQLERKYVELFENIHRAVSYESSSEIDGIWKEYEDDFLPILDFDTIYKKVSDPKGKLQSETIRNHEKYREMWEKLQTTLSKKDRSDLIKQMRSTELGDILVDIFNLYTSNTYLYCYFGVQPSDQNRMTLKRVFEFIQKKDIDMAECSKEILKQYNEDWSSPEMLLCCYYQVDNYMSLSNIDANIFAFRLETRFAQYRNIRCNTAWDDDIGELNDQISRIFIESPLNWCSEAHSKNFLPIDSRQKQFDLLLRIGKHKWGINDVLNLVKEYSIENYGNMIEYSDFREWILNTIRPTIEVQKFLQSENTTSEWERRRVLESAYRETMLDVMYFIQNKLLQAFYLDCGGFAIK